ncbi:MAG: hypothetical protein KAS32_02865 [Candidatus Peribacteraceae bacterium]|nr:hypothetical protein [Candidatus Peribacteraceae bacterium]
MVSSLNNFFHQSGHIIFGLPYEYMGKGEFTTFMLYAGGPFFELFIPLIVVLHLIFSRLFFAGSAVLFWFAFSLYTMSIYIADAIKMERELVGIELDRGHDWNKLFTQFDILDYTNQIASSVHATAIILFWTSVAICLALYCFYLFVGLKNRYFYK